MDFAGVARGQDPGFLDASIGTAPQSTMNPVISRRTLLTTVVLRGTATFDDIRIWRVPHTLTKHLLVRSADTPALSGESPADPAVSTGN